MAEPKPTSESEKDPSKVSNKAPSLQDLRHSPGHLFVVVIAVVAILFFGVFLGSMANIRHAQEVNGFRMGGPGNSKMSMRGGPGNNNGPAFSASSGNNSANQNILRGVVTVVNGTTLTIAGNGTTNTAQTTSSTQYTGGSAAAVNDTVIVYGSISNNTFTATRIVINP